MSLKQTRLTPEDRSDRMDRFLVAFSRTGIIGHGVDACGVTRDTIIKWRKRYPDFAARYDEAEAVAQDGIREAIRRRAIDGVEKPVYQGGIMVGTVTEYSDGLLSMMAKARLPEYKEKRSVELSGPDGGPIELSPVRERIAGRIAQLLSGDGALPDTGVPE